MQYKSMHNKNNKMSDKKENHDTKNVNIIINVYIAKKYLHKNVFSQNKRTKLKLQIN